MSSIIKDSKIVMKNIVDGAVKGNSLKNVRADEEMRYKIAIDRKGEEYQNLLLPYLYESGYITSIPRKENSYCTDVTVEGVNFAEMD